MQKACGHTQFSPRQLLPAKPTHCALWGLFPWADATVAKIFSNVCIFTVAILFCKSEGGVQFLHRSMADLWSPGFPLRFEPQYYFVLKVLWLNVLRTMHVCIGFFFQIKKQGKCGNNRLNRIDTLFPSCFIHQGAVWWGGGDSQNGFDTFVACKVLQAFTLSIGLVNHFICKNKWSAPPSRNVCFSFFFQFPSSRFWLIFWG